MNNPYSSPVTSDQTRPLDPNLLRHVAIHLAEARNKPPTILGTLLKWPGTPLMATVGILGTAILACIASLADAGGLSSHWPISFAAFTLGCLLRDFGTARRMKRLWPSHSYFIHWQKVDEFTA